MPNCLLTNLMCFADHLNSLLLVFCSFSFILAGPIVSFCYYLILMFKRMHLIQKVDSNSKHFSFFVFYFNVSNKISSTPPQALNFQEFSYPWFIPTLPPRLVSFEEFFNSHLFETFPYHLSIGEHWLVLSLFSI